MVMQRMEGGLTVALDPNLKTLERVWCIAEIGEAIRSEKPISYVGELAERFKDGEVDLQSVANCKATNPEDANSILEKIRTTCQLRTCSAI